MFRGIFRHNLSFEAIFAVLWILTDHKQSLAQELSTAPVATLFSQLDCKGQGIVTRTSLLTLPNFNDQAKSVMASGVWIFYENESYNGGKNVGVVEYIYNQNRNCVNFKNISSKISSLQLVGGLKNYSENVLNLFQGTYFQNNIQRIKNNSTKVNNITKMSSLIITGQSPWTVYSKDGFQGPSMCMKPPNSTNFTPGFEARISNIWKGKGTPIKSARKGCHGKSIYNVPAIPSNTHIAYTLHGTPN